MSGSSKTVFSFVIFTLNYYHFITANVDLCRYFINTFNAFKFVVLKLNNNYSWYKQLLKKINIHPHLTKKLIWAYQDKWTRSVCYCNLLHPFVVQLYAGFVIQKKEFLFRLITSYRSLSVRDTQSQCSNNKNATKRSQRVKSVGKSPLAALYWNCYWKNLIRLNVCEGK